MKVIDIAAVTVGFDDENVLLTIDTMTDDGPHTFVMAMTPFGALRHALDLQVGACSVQWPDQTEADLGDDE